MAQQRYAPETRTSEPKSTQGTEFVVKSTQEFYRGPYIEAYKGKYYAGSSIETSGAELEKVATKGIEDNLIAGVTANGYGLITTLLKNFFKKKLTKGELNRGVARRFFIQDKKNNKISETDIQTYLLAQKDLPNRRFAEIDWIIKGPSEDKNINGYKYEGAESRNKKTIQDLEKQMPGISLYVTNYKEFVQEPVIVQPLVTYTETQEDSQTSLENSRKANFDQKI